MLLQGWLVDLYVIEVWLVALYPIAVVVGWPKCYCNFGWLTYMLLQFGWLTYIVL